MEPVAVASCVCASGASVSPASADCSVATTYSTYVGCSVPSTSLTPKIAGLSMSCLTLEATFCPMSKRGATAPCDFTVASSSDAGFATAAAAGSPAPVSAAGALASRVTCGATVASAGATCASAAGSSSASNSAGCLWAGPPQRYVWIEWAGKVWGASRPAVWSTSVKLTSLSLVFIAMSAIEPSGFSNATYGYGQTAFTRFGALAGKCCGPT
mmetsp:Transcript_29881/g.91712  ORF Transcript_29881/g.91712 Transcript_29881/m.91712 type:complete len:213 (-) Transcript_29881:2131-2769(-)